MKLFYVCRKCKCQYAIVPEWEAKELPFCSLGEFAKILTEMLNVSTNTVVYEYGYALQRFDLHECVVASGSYGVAEYVGFEASEEEQTKLGVAIKVLESQPNEFGGRDIMQAEILEASIETRQ